MSDSKKDNRMGRAVKPKPIPQPPQRLEFNGHGYKLRKATHAEHLEARHARN